MPSPFPNLVHLVETCKDAKGQNVLFEQKDLWFLPDPQSAPAPTVYPYHTTVHIINCWSLLCVSLQKPIKYSVSLCKGFESTLLSLLCRQQRTI